MNKYFPRISRRITEPLAFVLLVTLFVLFAVLLRNLNEYRRLQSERTQVFKNLEFWKNVTIEKPNYRDAFMEAAILEYRLGNKDDASLYLEKALALDPNFEKAVEFKQILGE